MRMENSNFKLNLSESVLIGAGLLFFASSAFIATGGNYTILLVAKVVYGVGIMILIAGK